MDIVDEWDSGLPSTAHIGEPDVLGSEWTVVDSNPDTPGPPPIFSVTLVEPAITRCAAALSQCNTVNEQPNTRGRGAMVTAAAASDALLIATERATVLRLDAAAPSTLGTHPCCG